MTGATMTNAQKLRTLLAILECAPAAHAMTGFESAARSGDLPLFWRRYRSALRRSKLSDGPQLESKDEITLAMLEPAMKAVSALPTGEPTAVNTIVVGTGGASKG